MSWWVVSDDTPTGNVVWVAAERIGKMQSHEQLQKICDYLVNKHWFQTAGDLRSARQEATEWQALELPGRLKLAIQQVLEETTQYHGDFAGYAYNEYYAAVCPSGAATQIEQEAQSWEAATAVYSKHQHGQAAPLSNSASDYDYANAEGSATALDPGLQYYHDGTEGDEGHGEMQHYDGCATDACSDYGDPNTEQIDYASEFHHPVGANEVENCDSSVVEAHAVETDEATLAYEESGVVSEYAEMDPPAQNGETAGSNAASEAAAEETSASETWSCGQCTFLNPVHEAFCEMCFCHISQSAEALVALEPPAASTDLLTIDATESTSTPANAAAGLALTPTELPTAALYLPSAPDFECIDLEEDDNPARLPPPPPYSVVMVNSLSPLDSGSQRDCENSVKSAKFARTDDVDFLALAFSRSTSATSTKSPQRTPPGSMSAKKASQMRREETTTATERTL